MRYELIKYDTFKFNFGELIEDLFNAYKLEDLHEKAPEKYTELFKVGADSCTAFHKAFYDKYRSGWPEFEQLYRDFIKFEIAPFYPGKILYQAFPTFRVHLVNNVAVGDFHTDAEFGHPEGEVNYILPFTTSNYTASVWIESEPGKKDFEPALMQPGYMIRFNGNQLAHGNKINETPHTRVSIDFRILPFDKYNENHASKSLTQKTKFKIGEYYKLLE